MEKVNSASRRIDPKHLERASKVQPELVGPYLESILIHTHQALDEWRYRNGPWEDVALGLDAFVALWSLVEAKQTV